MRVQFFLFRINSVQVFGGRVVPEIVVGIPSDVPNPVSDMTSPGLDEEEAIVVVFSALSTGARRAFDASTLALLLLCRPCTARHGSGKNIRRMKTE